MADLTQLHREFVTEQRYATRLSEVTLRGYEQSFALLREVMTDISVDQISSTMMTEFFRRLETRTSARWEKERYCPRFSFAVRASRVTSIAVDILCEVASPPAPP